MWLSIAIGMLTGYLLGNLNGAVCISSLMNDDVRSHGSGNAGLTNFVRNYGNAKALYVIAVDAIKAILACLLTGKLLEPYGYYIEGVMLGGAAVMLGHVFPILLGFRGGKGILSGLFIALVADWRIGVLILAVFAAVYFLTWYVSLSSVLAAVFFGIGFCVLHFDNPVVVICGLFMAALTIYMHRSNIRRLVKGEESKTDFFAKEKKQ